MRGEPRRITVLGSTGSVGCNTLDIVGRRPGAFRVVALTANRNAAKLADQAKQFGAEFAVVADPAGYRELKTALAGSGIEAAAGAQALVEAAERLFLETDKAKSGKIDEKQLVSVLEKLLPQPPRFGGFPGRP